MRRPYRSHRSTIWFRVGRLNVAMAPPRIQRYDHGTYWFWTINFLPWITVNWNRPKGH